MHDDESTDVASFASPGKLFPLHQVASAESQEHLTWAYQTHVTAIYQYVYSRVGNRPDAEDLTSQVYMKATRDMRNDVSIAQLRSWLYRVALFGQVCFYALGALGIVVADRPIAKWEPVALPAYFVLINAAAARAIWQLLRGEKHELWQPRQAA